MRHSLLPLLVACFATATLATDTRPNLVFVLNDDVSAIEYDFLTAPDRATPSGAKTPNLDMMRAKGVSFLTGWSMPVCGPTRGSLMTGLYGHVTGWTSNSKPSGSLADRFGTFTTLAREAGYKVLIAGKWQMTGVPSSYGFHETCLWQADNDANKPLSFFLNQYTDAGGILSPGSSSQSGQGSRYWRPFIIKNQRVLRTTDNDFGPDVIFKCALDFIERHTRAGNKFLVYIPALLAHADYDFEIDDGKFDHYLPVPERNENGAFVRREPGPGSFKRNIEYQDYLMGTLLKHIDTLNKTRDTITFFVGDNGTLFYGKKKLVSERATRVPFLVYGPGRVQRRGDSSELVSTNDIYATLKSLMKARRFPDIPRPHSVDFSRYLLGSMGNIQRRWLYGLLEDKHWFRTKNHIYDGNKDLWKCPNRDERSCEIIAPRAYNDTEKMLISNFNNIACLLEQNKTVDPKTIKQTETCS